MTIVKRSVPQAVFDSPEAIKAAKEGHRLACKELNETPRHLLDPSNPNHPSHDIHIFGYHHEEFMARQYK